MITTGLLWCDNGKDNRGRDKPIAQMVKEAAQYYQVKHGVKPNCCLIGHGSAEPFSVDGITCWSAMHIAPYHLLIGVANETSDRGHTGT